MPGKTTELSRIERRCVEKGLKMTGQRRVIAQVLSESQDHPDVEQVYTTLIAASQRHLTAFTHWSSR